MQLSNNNLTNKVWVEISKKALIHNFNVFRKIASSKTQIMSVVKANAYGHGLKQVVPILDKTGTDWFGVDSLREALEIRSLGIRKPILVLGYVSLADIKYAVENDISISVYSKDVLKKIISLKLAKIARVHLKIETGLNRQGLDKRGALKLVKVINNKEAIILEGVSTHFADIEDTLDSCFAILQQKRFRTSVTGINKIVERPLNVHCAATAAALLYDSTHFSMIRVGIGLYGLWPSKETQIALSLRKKTGKVVLKPVMTWKSILVQVKTIEPGESVGYGRTWFAPRRSKIGIIPVGYYDGYDRKLSNNSKVIIKGELAPVIGRVAMNMALVDLTDIKKAKKGDEVVLLGKVGKSEVSAEDLANEIGTINYEVVSRVNPLIPRVVS